MHSTHYAHAETDRQTVNKERESDRETDRDIEKKKERERKSESSVGPEDAVRAE